MGRPGSRLPKASGESETPPHGRPVVFSQGWQIGQCHGLFHSNFAQLQARPPYLLQARKLLADTALGYHPIWQSTPCVW